MTEHLDAALAYAARGWGVFPVHGISNGHCSCQRKCSSPGKHPLVRRGLHEATTDFGQVTEWWTRWPFANIGIASGKIIVIDLDGPEGKRSVARLEHLGLQLSPTLTAVTGNGRHLYFTCDRRLPNTTRRLPGIDEELAGIDLRADGGYVVAPPSLHISGNRYEWINSKVPIASAPEWLSEPPRLESAVTPVGPPATESTPYGLAALRSEVEVLLRTPVGSRNDQLNRSAFALGQLIAGGELAEAPARSALQATARRIGLESVETRSTIQSGLASGLPGASFALS